MSSEALNKLVVVYDNMFARKECNLLSREIKKEKTRMKNFERLDRKEIYKGAIINVYKDTLRLPDGKIAVYDYIDHKGAAGVLPICDDGKILMVKQYRNALDRVTLEIPAGGLDTRQEPFIDCARRELEEETGYRSDQLEFLISIRTTVAFCNERIDIFTAKNLKPSHQNLDDDEYIDIDAYGVDELCDRIFSGHIQDSKTIAAIMSYKAIL